MNWLPTFLVACVCFLTTVALDGSYMDAVLMYLLLNLVNR